MSKAANREYWRHIRHTLRSWRVGLVVVLAAVITASQVWREASNHAAENATPATEAPR